MKKKILRSENECDMEDQRQEQFYKHNSTAPKDS